ncbi:hypothetical protein BU24DRAFT_60445 [Aaosphaeria arxii CBS 175.79]|uniref:Tim17-domain-containing protein n=1 Tax=Aaosphaeria arxii CBS 175.79 TaxID=1450172 RepID=A0A6A5XCP3_9PLEO|nr:uncharacterized protein BU24DRAFT_60445 [Aaosphaeria arxii CBS 175.79]KAF2010544.1 hypothetical protein BU24DRAFT_60445 [Aaosphaeria arxii CBS 175.79]
MADLEAATEAVSSSPSSSPTSPAELLYRSSPERLGMPFDRRLLLALSSSFLCGFTLGTSHAGHLASLRFRAENAHRLPISQPGWYLYHKSKNYYKAKEGIVVGVRKGGYLAAWTSIFFVLEESIDVFRGTWKAGRTVAEMEGVDELDMRDMGGAVERSRDFVSSGIAGMVTGGIWSAWNAFPMVTAARTIRLGLAVGLAFGLGQDGLTYLRGRSVGWVGEVAGKGTEEGQDGVEVEAKGA